MDIKSKSEFKRIVCLKTARIEQLEQALKEEKLRTQLWRQEVLEQGLKDHEIAHLVNRLTNIASTYAGTEQLREHISKCVVATIKD